jgi:pyruvate ferredoxin oxidoreductase beta subunit
VLATCPRGWRSAYNKSIEHAKLGVQTGYWPLFEVEYGEWKLSSPSKALVKTGLKPIEEFLKPQGRFRHLLKPENAELLAEVKADVDAYWDYLLKRCGEL